MIETAVVLCGKQVYWHEPEGRTGGSIPDSRTLWEFLWEFRKTVTGLAHSHPGGGLPLPSSIDVSTFRAVEQGLGKRLDWYIVSSEAVSMWRWSDEQRGAYCAESYHPVLVQPVQEPDWVEELRRRSGYE